MYGLLNELVIPALARQEEVMQELGLQCLGLICALDQTLAQSNMELFLTCIFAEQASDQLHQLSLKVLISCKGRTDFSLCFQDLLLTLVFIFYLLFQPDRV